MPKDDIGIVARGGDPLTTRTPLETPSPSRWWPSGFWPSTSLSVRSRDAALYRLAIESHITPRLGAIPIADVTTQTR